MTTLETPDLVVLVIYLGGVVLLGCYFVGRSRTAEAFTTGDRSVVGWAVGLSIFGTYVSSISFLANPGKSYADDWNPFVFGLAIPLAALIATTWFVPFYRKGGAVSAYAHLEGRFGLWARWYAGICFMLVQLARIGTILYLVALAVEPLTGWDVWWIIIAIGIAVILYTMLGGIEAVIWTDVVQSIVLTTGIVIALWLLLVDSPETWEQLQSSAPQKMSLGEFSWDMTQSTFWVVLLYGFFINLQNFGIDQTYVQRYIAAESDGAAKRSVWLGALLYLPVSALLFLVGTSLYAYYGVYPGKLPRGVEGDAVFPHFIATEMPPGVTGLLVAAIIAAAMSSVDSSLNSSSTLVLEDFAQRLGKGRIGARGQMAILYASTAVIGILGIGMALAMINVKSALDAWWKMAGLFSGGMLGLFLLAMVARRANWLAAAIGLTCGVYLIVFMAYSERNPLHDFMTIVCGTSVIVVVGLVATAFVMMLAGKKRGERRGEGE